MNNNRNNRRRGRSNRNQSGGGNSSGSAANRIDSRARGNAPQLLDKYKKLAQDAHHNGDRVQQEYYLQFADHYFRVIADNKARQDEARAKRDDRQSGDDDQDDDRDDDRHDDRRPNNQQNSNNNRRPRQRRDDRDNRDNRDRNQQGESSNEGSNYEPEDNPFVANEAPEKAADKPKKRAPRRKKADQANGDAGIDVAALPPAIGGDDSASGDDVEVPKKPVRRRAKSGPKRDEDSTLTSVS